MDNSILLQKAIRDNNEDLQNFMRDLKHWESDMKRKDSELSSEKGKNEILPPVRSKSQKIQSSTTKSVEKKIEKPKRISSYDYNSWDKFDVDKACEDVDKSKCENKKESSSESDREEEILRNQQQALYEKELGNNYVKKGNWEKAIEQYTKAIQCFNKDAVFFANRALCYLKTNKLLAADRDCTKSLELDSQYVKAYQRRAAARIGLKKLEDARADLNNVLRLEPNNIQAKRDLEKLEQTELPKEKVIATKENTKTKNVQPTKSDLSKKLDTCKDKVVVLEESDYQWGPDGGKRNINAIFKHPHLRSKEPLERIEIVDVDDTTSEDYRNKTKVLQKLPSKIISIKENEENRSGGDTLLSNKNQNERTNIKVKTLDYSSLPPEENSSNIDIPQPPRTSVQFNSTWKNLRNNPFSLYLYLKNINGKNFPSIFQDSMESDLFSQVIATLATEFINHSTPVLNYLEGLIKVRRFSMLVLFMSEQDCKGIKQLIDYCVSSQEITPDYAIKLKKSFQLV